MFSYQSDSFQLTCTLGMGGCRKLRGMFDWKVPANQGSHHTQTMHFFFIIMLMFMGTVFGNEFELQQLGLPPTQIKASSGRNCRIGGVLLQQLNGQRILLQSKAYGTHLLLAPGTSKTTRYPPASVGVQIGPSTSQSRMQVPVLSVQTVLVEFPSETIQVSFNGTLQASIPQAVKNLVTSYSNKQLSIKTRDSTIRVSAGRQGLDVTIRTDVIKSGGLC